MTGEALKSEKRVYLFTMHSHSYYILLHSICFCTYLLHFIHIYRKNSRDLT